LLPAKKRGKENFRLIVMKSVKPLKIAEHDASCNCIDRYSSFIAKIQQLPPPSQQEGEDERARLSILALACLFIEAKKGHLE